MLVRMCVSTVPFTIISPLPSRGRCVVTGPLQNTHEVRCISYKCSHEEMTPKGLRLSLLMLITRLK